MARPLRIEYPGAWYHVLNRGRRREEIFFSKADYEKFFALLGEVVELYSAEIHAYSLMPNHYHLLVCTPSGNLSKIMRHINGIYTQYINRKIRGGEGSLFKGRYKSILVNSEEYLLDLVRYIHRNPFKAKLESKLGQHPWTSHRAYLYEKQCPDWLCTKEVLRRFSRYRGEAKQNLAAYVRQEVPRDLEKRLDSMNWPAILGGDDFKEVVKQYVCGKRFYDTEVPEGRKLRDEVSVEEIARTVEGIAGIGCDVLSMVRRVGTRDAKAAFVYVCRTDVQCAHYEIGKLLGGISRSRISKLYMYARDEVKRRGTVYRIVQRCRKLLS